MIFISPFSGALIARFGARRLMTFGMTLARAGAVGVAGTGAVFHALRDDPGFTYSLANSFWVLVGVLAAGVVLTWAFVRSAPGAAPVKPIEHRLRHRRFHL